MSVRLSISSHVKISYFYVCSDATFLGGRNPYKTLQFIYNKLNNVALFRAARNLE